jgi:hypothetical protein
MNADEQSHSRHISTNCSFTSAVDFDSKRNPIGICVHLRESAVELPFLSSGTLRLGACRWCVVAVRDTMMIA